MVADASDNKLWAYSDLILVHCPMCKKCTKIFTLDDIQVKDMPRILGHEPKRLLCVECGFVKELYPIRRWDNVLAFRQELYDIKKGIDWYFGLPLYLQTKCCGQNMWFLNYEHLKDTEDYIKKELRPSRLYYLSAASRLPKWMKLSKNRAEVLKAITKLKNEKII